MLTLKNEAGAFEPPRHRSDGFVLVVSQGWQSLPAPEAELQPETRLQRAQQQLGATCSYACDEMPCLAAALSAATALEAVQGVSSQQDTSCYCYLPLLYPCRTKHSWCASHHYMIDNSKLGIKQAFLAPLSS